MRSVSNPILEILDLQANTLLHSIDQFTFIYCTARHVASKGKQTKIGMKKRSQAG